MFVSRFMKWFLMSVVVILLIACGGGGSADTSTTTTTTATEIYYETITFEGKMLEAYNEYLDAADQFNYEEVNATLNSNNNIEVIFSDIYSIIFKIDGIEFTHTNKALRDSNTSIGSAANPKQLKIEPQTTFSKIESQKSISISTNKRAILFLPYFSEFGTTEVIEIQNLLKNNGFDMTIRINEEVSVEEVTNSLEKYDLIYFSTHGREDGGMALGEKLPEGVVIDTIKNPYLFNAEGGRIGIKPDFFKNKKLNNSLVILHACQSMYKNYVSSALLSSGAKVVLGWDDYISWNSIVLADVMLSKMIDTCEPFEESIISAQQQIISDKIEFDGSNGEEIGCSVLFGQDDCSLWNWNLGLMTYEAAFSHLKVAYGYDTAVDDFYLNADCGDISPIVQPEPITVVDKDVHPYIITRGDSFRVYCNIASDLPSGVELKIQIDDATYYPLIGGPTNWDVSFDSSNFLEIGTHTIKFKAVENGTIILYQDLGTSILTIE